MSVNTTYNVGKLSERLLGNIAWGLVFGSRKVDDDQFKRYVFLLQDRSNTLGARRARIAEEFENHDELCERLRL
jgi:hypothetical protein